MVCPKCEGSITRIHTKYPQTIAYICRNCFVLWNAGERIASDTGHPLCSVGYEYSIFDRYR